MDLDRCERTIPHNSFFPFHPTMEKRHHEEFRCAKKKKAQKLDSNRQWIGVTSLMKFVYKNIWNQRTFNNQRLGGVSCDFLLAKKGEPFLQRVRFSKVLGVGRSSVLASRHGTVMEPPELDPEWTLGMWGSRRIFFLIVWMIGNNMILGWY